MSNFISKSDLDTMLDNYQSNLVDMVKKYPLDLELKGKLSALKDIRHRILVLSKGGFKIIKS